jgi:hypothetical protein
VTLTLQSVLYDLSVSDIVWSKDGSVVAEGTGLTTYSLTAGEAGTQTDISADAASPTGSASTDITIVPTTVDLLWEADTYTPPLYLGRALPSAGTQIRLVALAHFTHPDGSSVAPSDITYTWRKDGQVLTDFSGRGKSSALVDSPTLFGSENIVVDAASADGSLAGEATVRLNDTKPFLLLYENHPLFGILYGQALSPTTLIPDSEMTFAASPYFAPAASASDAHLQYAWRVNDSAVQADSVHADELTINAASSSGLALVSLSLTHDSNYFFSTNGIWNITLNSKNGGGAFNPFQ